jgi:hypothetical protein
MGAARLAAPPTSRFAPTGATQSLGDTVDGLNPFKTSVVTVTPATVALLAAGTATVTLAEKSYTGKFTVASTCGVFATVKPATLKGPSVKVTVTGVKGTPKCTFTFSDAKKHKAVLSATVTSSTFAIGATSISPNSKSAFISLVTVNGKTPSGVTVRSVKVNLPSPCTSGCSVSGPQTPPGIDAFSIAIYDGSLATGKRLAYTTSNAALSVAAAKANALAVPQLAKVVAKFGVVISPAGGTAGTASSSTVTISGTDPDSKPIATGSRFAVPASLRDSDTTLATKLSSTGVTGPGSTSLAYNGLAILPATITAFGTGVTSGTAVYTPVLSNIVYTSTSATAKTTSAEVDLYATSGTGSSGTFTATQKGWVPTPSGVSPVKAFTFTTGGSPNNCASTYTITPAPGSVAYVYSIVAKSTAVAGECTLTIVGGAGKTLPVLLTFTTTGIGINAKHH